MFSLFLLYAFDGQEKGDVCCVENCTCMHAPNNLANSRIVQR